MLWYRKLQIVASAATVAVFSATAVVADSYANAWDFSQGEEFTVPASASAIPLWTTIPYDDTLLWDGCELFLAEHPDALLGTTTSNCVSIIAEISGLRNPDVIPEGAMVMVPSPHNTSAAIAAQRSERIDLQALAGNPMGVAEAIMLFNHDVDAHNQRLIAAEGRLDEHNERFASQADRLSDLEDQVATLAETAGANLTAAEVRVIATEVLEEAGLEPGMTEFEVDAQVRAALDEQQQQFEQLASDVEELREELAAVRSAQLSPEEYARTALMIARDLGVSDERVRSVVEQAISDLDLVAQGDVSAAVDAALEEVRTRVSTLETQVSTLQDELRNLRSESAMSPEAYAQAAIAIARDLGMSEADVNEAVQTALSDLDLVAQSDVSAAVDAALEDGDYLTREELDTVLDDLRSEVGDGTPAWVPAVSAAALGLGVLLLLFLAWKSRRDKRQSKTLSGRLDKMDATAEESTKATEKAQATADGAKTEAGKAKALATKAMTHAKTAIDLQLKPDQRLKGDLPTEEELKALAEDEVVEVTIRKDDGSDVVVRFTRVTNLLDDGEGNRFDGFKVEGINRLKQGVKMHPSNMLRVMANANKNNTLAGVSKTSTT